MPDAGICRSCKKARWSGSSRAAISGGLSSIGSTKRQDCGNGWPNASNEGGEFHGAPLVRLEAIDLTTGFSAAQTYQIGASDPLSAKAAITAHAMLRRKNWTAAVRAAVELRATKDSFIVTARLTANEGSAEIIARTWEEKIGRDLL